MIENILFLSFPWPPKMLPRCPRMAPLALQYAGSKI